MKYFRRNIETHPSRHPQIGRRTKGFTVVAHREDTPSIHVRNIRSYTENRKSEIVFNDRGSNDSYL